MSFTTPLKKPKHPHEAQSSTQCFKKLKVSTTPITGPITIDPTSDEKSSRKDNIDFAAKDVEGVERRWGDWWGAPNTDGEFSRYGIEHTTWAKSEFAVRD